MLPLLKNQIDITHHIGNSHELEIPLVGVVELPRFAPTAGFADRVMSKVKVPTPSGDWQER